MKKILLLVGVLVILLSMSSCFGPMFPQQPYVQQQYGQSYGAQSGMQQFNRNQYQYNRAGMCQGSYFMDGIGYRSRQEYLQYEQWRQSQAYYYRGY